LTPMNQFILCSEIYPRECVRAAIESYKTHLNATILEQGDSRTVVALDPWTSDFEADTVVREFLNYLLDLSIRQHLGSNEGGQIL
jgi:hypothetical protein